MYSVVAPHVVLFQQLDFVLSNHTIKEVFSFWSVIVFQRRTVASVFA